MEGMKKGRITDHFKIQQKSVIRVNTSIKNCC